MAAAVSEPIEECVHLRFWLTGVAFEYQAPPVVVQQLLEDWNRKRWCTIELILDPVESLHHLAHLPCERLFLGP